MMLMTVMFTVMVMVVMMVTFAFLMGMFVRVTLFVMMVVAFALLVRMFVRMMLFVMVMMAMAFAPVTVFFRVAVKFVKRLLLTVALLHRRKNFFPVDPIPIRGYDRNACVFFQ